MLINNKIFITHNYLNNIYKSMSHLKNIKFGTPPVPINQLEYAPSAKLYTYYQICQFKNPFNEKYDTRKVVFNDCGEIKKIYERQYNGSELKPFLKSNIQNKYRMYPAREISSVAAPNSGELLEVCSTLVNNDCNCYDYQNF